MWRRNGLRIRYAYSTGGALLSRVCARRLRGGRARGREARAMPPTLPDVDAALARAGRYRPMAERALADDVLDREAALAVVESPDENLADVLWAAFAARRRHFGRSVKLCLLQNARSGLCPEDCGYCSQSAVSTADIPRYRLLPVSELLAGARRAAASGARRYCMVVSGRGPSPPDIAHFARAARAIRA